MLTEEKACFFSQKDDNTDILCSFFFSGDHICDKIVKNFANIKKSYKKIKKCIYFLTKKWYDIYN